MATLTIPEELTGRPCNNTGYNAAWLDTYGNFHMTAWHSELVTPQGVGYEHYDLGWLRIVTIPDHEIGFENRRSAPDPTKAQIEAIRALVAVIKPRMLLGTEMFGNWDGPAITEVSADRVRRLFVRSS